MLNRHQSAREYGEHRQLVTDTMAYLSSSVSISSIASRGTRLLSELLAEEENHAKNTEANHSPQNGKQGANDGRAVSKVADKSLDVAAFVKKFCESDQPPPGNSPIATSHMPLWLQRDDSYQPYLGYRRRSQDVFSPNRESSSYATSRSKAPQQLPYDSLDPGYQSASGCQLHGNSANPFTQHFSESFDIRSVNWFDDLLDLAPSHSI
jgi:hypothetical protein